MPPSKNKNAKPQDNITHFQNFWIKFLKDSLIHQTHSTFLPPWPTMLLPVKMGSYNMLPWGNRALNSSLCKFTHSNVQREILLPLLHRGVLTEITAVPETEKGPKPSTHHMRSFRFSGTQDTCGGWETRARRARWAVVQRLPFPGLSLIRYCGKI